MDVLITSPILQPEDMGTGEAANPAGGAPAGGNNEFADLGFDPSMDPELAMAIRLSMEEANAAAANPEPVAAQNNAPVDPAPGVQPGLQAANADDDDGMYDEDEDERNIALALAMSNPDGAQAADSNAEDPKEEIKPAEAENVDIDANFMKDVIGDIGIDIDPTQLDDIVNQVKNTEDDKKDKKDGDDKKKE